MLYKDFFNKMRNKFLEYLNYLFKMIFSFKSSMTTVILLNCIYFLLNDFVLNAIICFEVFFREINKKSMH